MSFNKKHAANLIKILRIFVTSKKIIFGGCFLVTIWYIWGSLAPADAPLSPDQMWYKAGYQIPEITRTKEELQKLLSNIEKWNRDVAVRNGDRYGVVRPNTTVIAVQVHKDAERLQYLVASLANVTQIQQVLLVFSHSYYDERLNEFIASINFCRVIQIYYPYSLQLYPDRFPGLDPDDGFNRDARRCERKQHWWWKARFVFNMRPKSKKRLVIFLEENDIVLPDFLYLLRYMQRVQRFFPRAEVVAFGRPVSASAAYDSVMLDTWSPKYERGIAFKSTLWQTIFANASLFCQYDDCSWSHSLAHVFESVGRRVDVAAAVAPRVLGTGAGAGGAAGARRASGVARRARLFPPLLNAVLMVVTRRRAPPPALPRTRPARPGCGSPRDQNLCLDIARMNTSTRMHIDPLYYLT